MTLNVDSESFVVHVAIQERKKIVIDLGRKTQIKAQNRAHVRVILFHEAPTEVPVEYSNYNNIFSVKNTADLPENTEMNEHAIKLEESKQLLFGAIYSLGQME